METKKPIIILVKNYYGDDWRVIEYFSAQEERIIFKGTYKQAKEFKDAERAKRGA